MFLKLKNHEIETECEGSAILSCGEKWGRQPCNRQTPTSNSHAVHSKASPRCRKRRNWLGLDQRKVFGPKGAEIAFFPEAVEIQEISLVALTIGRETFVCICNVGLVQHGKSVACCFSLIGQNCGEELFINGRLILPSDFESAGIRVPLDRVAEQVRQQEKTLLGRYRIVDVDFQAIQIAGQRVGNVPGHHSNTIAGL